MYEYAFTSPIYLILTVIYFLAASVVTFDMRLIQARRQGDDFGMLPRWIGIFWFAQWGLFATLFILNWKYALILFALKFVLKVLPVLELVGNILCTPLNPKQTKPAYSETALTDDQIASIGKHFNSIPSTNSKTAAVEEKEEELQWVFKSRLKDK